MSRSASTLPRANTQRPYLNTSSSSRHLRHTATVHTLPNTVKSPKSVSNGRRSPLGLSGGTNSDVKMPAVSLKRCSSSLSRRRVNGSNSPQNKFKYAALKDKLIALEESKIGLRREVISGNFMHGEIEEFSQTTATTVNQWRFRQWQMLVFVSSTFTDTRCERNILLDRILPQLRQLSYPHDIEVTFVDMRWGVLDKHMLDHRTWDECKREIQRCRDESRGLFFISLQNDKYGYRPLPRSIERRTFESIIEKCDDPALVTLAQNWYSLDTNANPVQYTLKSLETVDNDPYWDIMQPLRTLFNGVRFDKSVCRDVAVGRSISEWEVKYALKNDIDVNRVLWIRRNFVSPCTDKNYCDSTDDTEVQKHICDLRDWMTRRIAKYDVGRIHVHNNISYASMTDHDSTYLNYMSTWEKRTLDALTEELSAIIHLRQNWESSGCGMGFPGAAVEEFLHHCKLAHDMCLAFAGREEILRQSLDMLQTPNKIVLDPRDARARAVIKGKDDENRSTGRYNCISMVLTGDHGVGKSALMARLAQMIYDKEIEMSTASNSSKSVKKKVYKARPVIVRFCGTSDSSSRGDVLVHSLRLQMEYLMGPATPPNRCGQRTTDWEALNYLLGAHAVVLVLDAVDEITGGVSFLQDIVVHSDTRIIVSTCTDDDLGVTNLLRDEKVRRINIPDLSMGPSNTSVSSPTKSRESGAELPEVANSPTKASDDSQDDKTEDQQCEAHTIVEKILASKGRTLTDSQWDMVMNRIAEEPTALYASLVARVVQNWNSDTSTPELGTTLSGIFSQVLDDIEQKCGEVMTRIALSLITFSCHGVDDLEMEDMLSMDDELLYAVCTHDFPGLFRLPCHVWARLRVTLGDLISERPHGCVSWRHEQFQQLAEERFAGEKNVNKVALHKVMGQYYGNDVNVHQREVKKLSSHPVLLLGTSCWIQSAVVNLRRCQEAAGHFTYAGQIYRAVDELCNFENICASMKCGQGHRIVILLDHILGQLKEEDCQCEGSGDEELITKIDHYLKWLRRSSDRISGSPELMIPTTVTAEPLHSVARSAFLEYITQLPVTQDGNFLKTSWLKGMAYIAHPTERDDRVLQAVHCVRWCPNGRHIAAAGEDGYVHIWDTFQNGSAISHNHDKPVLALGWNSTGSFLAAGCRDGNLVVWSVLSSLNGSNGQSTTTALSSTLHGGHSMDINSICWSPDDEYMATGSKDSSVIVWNMQSRQQLFTLKKFNDYFISDVQWSPDGKSIAASSLSNTVRVWNVADKKAKAFSEHKNKVTAICWNQAGDKIASASDDGTVAIWNSIQTTTVYFTFREHKRAVKAVSWCVDDELLLSGDCDGIIMLWSFAKKALLASFQGHMGPVTSVQWSPDGKKFLSSAMDPESSTVLWDSVRI